MNTYPEKSVGLWWATEKDANGNTVRKKNALGNEYMQGSIPDGPKVYVNVNSKKNPKEHPDYEQTKKQPDFNLTFRQNTQQNAAVPQNAEKTQPVSSIEECPF